MTGQTIELERPEQVVEHLPGLTQPIDSTDRRATVNGTRTTDFARYWSRVSPTGFCWEWTGYKGRAGYGQLNIDGHTEMAHRVSYRLLVGPIPEGLQLDHLCRNTSCVNPDHLEPVTSLENRRRQMAVRPRDVCAHGHELDDMNRRQLPDGVLGRRFACRQCELVRDHVRRGADCSHDNFCSAPSHSGRLGEATTCRKGHSMADAYVLPNGRGRLCRTCKRIRRASDYAKSIAHTPKENQS